MATLKGGVLMPVCACGFMYLDTSRCKASSSLTPCLAPTHVCLHVCPGVPAGAPRDDPGNLGSFNRGARQSATVQLAICYAEIPPGQLLPHHALPLQRVLRQHGGAAGL